MANVVRRMTLKKTHVVALAASKGGAGKSTLATCLAVRAAKESGSVCLVDLDPQESASRWHQLRGSPTTPRLVNKVENIADTIGELREEGVEWVIIDLPPAFVSLMEATVAEADFVLVPVRPSMFDVDAVDVVVETCIRARTPMAFVLNAVEARWKMSESAAKFLRVTGKVLAEEISQRKAYAYAAGVGRTGPEMDRAASAEIDALWQSVKHAVQGKVRA
jgi:chromosome partitioning protein